MSLREKIYRKLEELNRLDLWPQIRIEIFSMENQGLCEKYLELAEEGYKCENTINSWVAYILGICDDEPTGDMKIIKSPKLADIDSDFDKDRRGEVIDLVKEWFGADNVGQISAYGQYRIKSAVQSVLKYKMATRGEDPAAGEAISKNVPYEIEQMDISVDQKFDLILEVHQELAAYLNKHPEEKALIQGILGAYSDVKPHAAGIVIGPRPIHTIVPTLGTKKGPVTAMDKDDVESMGLVKFDFLGLANMTMIAKCLELIEQRHGRKIDLVNEVDLTDQQCLDRFNAGDVDTIFQFETSSFQDILTNQVEVDSFDDLVTINAINRPGPKKFISDHYYERYRTKEVSDDSEEDNIDPINSPIGTYATNKKMPHLIKSPHPALDDILKETYGIPVYQEQIMRMVRTLSGASMTDADKLRAAIGKKKKELFEECIQDFYKGSRANGVEDSVIHEVTQLIQKFGKYGFNKAHAAGYSLIGFWNMWLKTYYPAEWYTAVFTVEFSETTRKNNMLAPCYVRGTSPAGKFKQEFPRKLDWYIYGASSGGYNGRFESCSVFSPSLNISHSQDAVIQDVNGKPRIYLPFSIIHGLGKNMLSIIENRDALPEKKYNTLEDFVMYSGVTEKLGEKLIDHKVLEDDFGDETERLKSELLFYIKVRSETQKAERKRLTKTEAQMDEDLQEMLFGEFEGSHSIQLLDEKEDISNKKKKKKKDDEEVVLEMPDSWF